MVDGGHSIITGLVKTCLNEFIIIKLMYEGNTKRRVQWFCTHSDIFILLIFKTMHK